MLLLVQDACRQHRCIHLSTFRRQQSEEAVHNTRERKKVLIESMVEVTLEHLKLMGWHEEAEQGGKEGGQARIKGGPKGSGPWATHQEGASHQFKQYILI